MKIYKENGSVVIDGQGKSVYQFNQNGYILECDNHDFAVTFKNWRFVLDSSVSEFYDVPKMTKLLCLNGCITR